MLSDQAGATGPDGRFFAAASCCGRRSPPKWFRRVCESIARVPAPHAEEVPPPHGEVVPPVGEAVLAVAATFASRSFVFGFAFVFRADDDNNSKKSNNNKDILL